MEDGADKPVRVTGVNPDGHLAAWTLCSLIGAVYVALKA